MNQRAHLLAVSGALSQLLLPAGILAAQLGLLAAVAAVEVGQVSNDPDRIMASIQASTNQMESAFGPFLWGLGLAMAGLILFIIAITRFRYRQTWAFWFSCLYGGCLLGLFPPFGLFLLIFALMHRNEFLPVPIQPSI